MLLALLAFLIGLFLSVAWLADWFTFEVAWLAVCLFAGLAFTVLGWGPPVPPVRRRVE